MQRLDDMRSDLEAAVKRQLELGKAKLDAAKATLEVLKPLTQISQIKEKLASYPARLRAAIDQTVQKKQEALLRLKEHLASLNPQNVLKKGYCILFSEKEDSIILSAKDLSPSQKFTALLHDGKIAAKVDVNDDTRYTLF